ncbi:MAG: DUF4340 domain-containing protein [Planctomycetota bacterium]|nr:MAG: DUF4340 domain-containing protein [Planctomycetota bacterium]
MKTNLLLPLCAVAFVVTAIPAWLIPHSHHQSSVIQPREFFGPAVSDGSEVLALARRVGTMTNRHYDHEQAFLHHFEVTRRDGEWRIPSHHNYPADGGDQVGRTAGSVLGLQRRAEARVTSDRRDHQRLGVLDPEDDRAPFGVERGKRITLQGFEGETLLDLIIGKEVPDRLGWHYVRLADEDSVYQVEVEPVLSTRFTDYVERDLLRIGRNDITAVVMDPHRVDRAAGNVITPPKVTLRRQGSTQVWTSPDAPAGLEVDADAMRKVLDGITRVRLQGVRPLQPLSMVRMQRYGFFTNDGVTVWGNEGALEIQRRNGLRYTLYFGNRAPDEGLALTAGIEDADTSTQPGSNRYMIILVEYREDADQLLAEALRDLSDEHEAEADDTATDLEAALTTKRREVVAQRTAQRDEEQAKFIEYFYVIPGSVFDALRPDIESLFSQPAAEDAGSDPATITPAP